jgi:phosphodiesterase/alkaline phosphatase D-like protein
MTRIHQHQIKQSGGLLMRGFFLTLAILVPIAGWASSAGSKNLVTAAAPTHGAAVLTTGPDLESASDTLAIIRWTTTNPGGTDLHFGIAHYGTDPKNMNKIAKSPNRLNRSRPETIFRVRIDGLDPHTTYYYRVESVGATGINDGVSSPVKTFKTK